MLRRSLNLALFLIAIVFLAQVADACPSCKLALASQDKAQGDIVTAYMYSILFMMAMPFLLLGTFGTYIYFQLRNARREKEAQAILTVPVHSGEPVTA